MYLHPRSQPCVHFAIFLEENPILVTKMKRILCAACFLLAYFLYSLSNYAKLKLKRKYVYT